MRCRQLLWIGILALVWIAASPVAADQNFLEGRWIVGEAEGDDFDRLLEVKADGEGSMGVVKGERHFSSPLTFTPLGDGLFRFSVEADEAEGFALRHRENEIYLWVDGRRKLGWGRRLGGLLPEEILGEWLEFEPGPAMGRTYTLDSERLVVTETGDAGPVEILEGRLIPVVSEPDLVEAVLLPETGESRLLLFRAIGGTLLISSRDEDEFVLLHRPGQRPDWMDKEKGSRAGKDSAEKQRAP